MAYRPIQSISQTSSSTTSLMAEKGINTRELPQLLAPSSAQLIENYFITATGQLEKRKGYTELADASSTNAITMLEKFTSDILIFAYDTTIAKYTISTDTITNLKTNFTTSDPFSGVKYGDYFYASNGGDKIGFTHTTGRFLNFDAQTGNFAVGEVVTGAGGATGTVIAQIDNGTSGMLILDSITGVFVNNEALTGSVSGAATVDGVLYDWYELANVPKAKHLYAFQSRLFAGNTDTDSTEVHFSKVDDGTNPPFQTWTVGTGASSPGKVRYRNAGDVNAIGSLGSQIVVLYDDGKAGFRITTIDSAGVLVQDNPVDFQRVDFGGERGAAVTPKGIFYTNEAGVWQMVSGGQTNIPYSDQESELTLVFSENNIEDISFTNSDVIYDIKTNSVYVACAQKSSVNNIVLVYNLDMKAWSIFNGWKLSRFTNIGDTIYAGDAAEAKIYQLFDGSDDNGNAIPTEYLQELNVGALWTAKELIRFYINGQLANSSSLEISFDIYDITGTLVERKRFNNEADVLNWTSSGIVGLFTGGIGMSFGGPYGGSETGETSLSNSFAGYKVHIANFQRILIRIKSNDKSQHTLNWMSVNIREKQPIERRNLSI